MSPTAEVTVPLKLTYHGGQDAVFSHPARRKTVAKGRRWGFTQGAAQYVIEQMLQGMTPVLWGDTIATNITKYIERYFVPVLKQLPASMWEWKKQEKTLRIAQAVCDFRSADQPENWEGFGYKLIILNEAGIILKNPYLWHNAVRPMLMDYPDSLVIIGGTPKGKNLFHELFLKSTDGWQPFTFSSYDNPFLQRSEIDAMERELPDSVVRQEIYAEFVGEGESVLIPYDLIMVCVALVPPETRFGNEVWGLDVARQGDDFSVLAKRHYRHVHSLQQYSIPDMMQLASMVNVEYQQAAIKPRQIFVETTFQGWGVVDRLRELGVPAIGADPGAGATEPALLNKRAEMYVRLLQAMRQGITLPNHKGLIKQLANVYIEYKDARMKLVSKEQIKQEIGCSPDHADAVALTYFEELPVAVESYTDPVSSKALSDWNPIEAA